LARFCCNVPPFGLLVPYGRILVICASWPAVGLSRPLKVAKTDRRIPPGQASPPIPKETSFRSPWPGREYNMFSRRANKGQLRQEVVALRLTGRLGLCESKSKSTWESKPGVLPLLSRPWPGLRRYAEERDGLFKRPTPILRELPQAHNPLLWLGTGLGLGQVLGGLGLLAG